MADFSDLANKDSDNSRGKKRNSRRAFETDGKTLKDEYSVQIDGERVGIYSKKGNPITKSSREGMRAMKRIVKSRNMQKDMSDKMLKDEVAMAKAVGADMKKHTRTAAEQDTSDQVHRIGDPQITAAHDDTVEGELALKPDTKTVLAKVESNTVNVTAEDEMQKLDELQEVEPDHDRTTRTEVQHVSAMEVDKEAVKEVVDTKQDEEKTGIDLTFRVIHDHVVLELFGSQETYKRFFDAFISTRPKERRSNKELFEENQRIVQGTDGINITSPFYDASAQRHDLLLENIELKLMRGRVVGNPTDLPTNDKTAPEEQKQQLNIKPNQRIGILVDAKGLGISVSKLQALLKHDSDISNFTSQPQNADPANTAGAGIFGDYGSTGQRIGNQRDRGSVQNNSYKHNDLRLHNTHRIDATYPNVPRSKMLRNVQVEQKQFDRVLRFKTAEFEPRRRIS
jgi:hypothetical protein